MYEVCPVIARFIVENTKSWKVALQLNHSRESIPSRQRKNQVWHFHGDSLSSLLFCIALAHLSLLLNDSTDGHMSQYGELNHIFCSDDLKTFAKDDGQQQGLLTIVKTFSSRVTLRWNLVLKRCAKATFKRRRFTITSNIHTRQLYHRQRSGAVGKNA